MVQYRPEFHKGVTTNAIKCEILLGNILLPIVEYAHYKNGLGNKFNKRLALTFFKTIKTTPLAIPVKVKKHVPAWPAIGCL